MFSVPISTRKPRLLTLPFTSEEDNNGNIPDVVSQRFMARPERILDFGNQRKRDLQRKWLIAWICPSR